MRPFVGISCCSKGFGIFAMPNHAASDTYIRSVDQVVGAIPLLIPALGDRLDIPAVLARVDGLLLTGSRSNVLPALYGGPPHPEGTPEDPARDAVTLPLIRAAIEAGVPLLAICRGMQELNVALGGTLDQRIQDLPGRIDHSTCVDQTLHAVRVAKAHAVRVEPGSLLHRIARQREFGVNSLHNQGVAKLAPDLVVEGTAPDGTIEAVRVRSARGFAFGVQWHPEYDFETDAISRAILAAFGDAVRARMAGQAGIVAAE